MLRCDLHLELYFFLQLAQQVFGVLSHLHIKLEIIMVIASQLQLLQSPVTALISSIPTSVNVKLDESNYLNWNFQMQLLLESNGIMGYVDGCSPIHLNNVQSRLNLVSPPLPLHLMNI